MNAVTLPKEFDAWAEAEVAAGRAESVEEVATKALRGYHRYVEELRALLDEAEREADELGWLSAADVFDRIEAELRTEIEAEEWSNARSA